MPHTARRACCWSIAALSAITSGAAWAAPPRSRLSDLAPPDALAAIGVTAGANRLDDLKSSAFWEMVRQSPLYAFLKTTPQYKQAMVGINVLQATTQLTAWDAAAAALGDETLLTICPRAKDAAKGVAFLAMARHDDPDRLAIVERVLKQIHMATGLLIDDEPDPEKSFVIGKTTVWQTPGDLYHALSDGVVLLSNSKSLIRRSLERADNEKQRLTDSPFWKDSLQHLAPRADAWAMLDMRAFRRMIPEKVWPPPADNPLGAMLFSDWSDRLRDATHAVASLSICADAVELQARIVTEKSGKPRAATSFAPLALDSLPRGLLHYTVSADFERWWNTREKTMNEAAIADFGKFAGVMTTLMGGLDYSDEFLPNIVPGAQLLLARQTFAERPRPSPILPAFALVFRLKADSKIGPRLDSAATMALSFLNLDAGQKGEAQFLINLEEYHGHKVTWTQYPDKASEKPPGASQPAAAASSAAAGIRYNFEPAMTRVGDVVIIATSREMARDVVDAIEHRAKDGSPAKPAVVQDQILIDARSLRGILDDNREQFITEQMLKNDLPKREAARRVDAFLAITDWFRAASLTAAADRPVATMTLRLDLKTP